MPYTTDEIDEKTMQDRVEDSVIGQTKVQKRHKYIWVACTICGNERWVALQHGRPCKELCFPCAMRKRRKSSSIIPDDKEYLTMLYWENNESLKSIGRRYGLSAATVSYKFHLLQIPTRTKLQGLKIAGLRERGCMNPAWKGGRTQNGTEGYVFIYKPGHPRAHQNYVAEHILVCEEANGISIPQGWEVHHFNGVKNENHPGNLFAMPTRKHKGIIAEFQKKILDLGGQLCRLEGKK